jgi:hypothetical protein
VKTCPVAAQIKEWCSEFSINEREFW